MADYNSSYTGAQIDSAVGKALSPDSTPTADSQNLITSGAVKRAINNAIIRPNLLDNWYFVGGGSQQGGGQFPVNQRGQTVYSGSGYTIDRWRMWDGNDSLTIASDGVSFLSPNDNGLFQYFPYSPFQNGDVVTISALINGNLFTATGEKQNGVLSIHDGTNAVNYDESASFFTFYIKNATNVLKIAAAKLELGSTQTLCHNEGTDANPVWVLNEIPNYQQELAKCQRYFVKFMVAGDFFSDSYGIVSIPVYYPVRLNKNPTSVTIDNFQYYWSSWQTPTLNDVRSNSDDMCGLRLATTISTPAYTTCSGYVNIEADL
jgi:hypothetical protein